MTKPGHQRHNQVMPFVRLGAVLLFVFLSVVLMAEPLRDPNASVRIALQSELNNPSPTVGPAVLEYRKQLAQIGGWNAAERHEMKLLPTILAGQPESLGVNLFLPEGEPQGTLLFVHGYLSHSANFAYTFSFFAARGWRVVTLDLPGHGFSTGKRGDVESFGDYGDAVALWLAWVGEQGWKGPKVLLAHSLGTAACLEALRGSGVLQPDRVIFCAPLLRPDWFAALSFGEATLGWLFPYLPQTFGWDGYLDGYAMPARWFAALGRWLDNLEGQPPLVIPLTVYSGDQDEVVDEGWNLAEYQRLVPGVQTVLLPGKGHLFLTAKEDRQDFHEQLNAQISPMLLPIRTPLEPEKVSLTVTLTSGLTIPLEVRRFRPSGSSAGTVLLLHGYLADSADSTFAARWFAARNWTAVTLDLPGHGGSGGIQHDIGDFADYGDAAVLAMRWAFGEQEQRPRLLIAHSLGCAAALEALMRPGAEKPDKVVFLAPLLRTTWWGPLTLAQDLGGLGLPRSHWFGQLRQWVGRLEGAPQVDIPLTVYQGDLDGVVEASWNQGKIQALVPGTQWVWLKGKDHWFHADTRYREGFLQCLWTNLKL